MNLEYCIKIIISIHLFGFSVFSMAEDLVSLKKCLLMSRTAENIVNDRDNGISYKIRTSLNKKLSKDIPVMHDFLFNMTNAIYFDLKNRPKSEIVNAVFYGCMKGDDV